MTTKTSVLQTHNSASCVNASKTQWILVAVGVKQQEAKNIMRIHWANNKF